MNQLEHLKALRDKARVQTEQAKAVLKQQGEISESLDRLIAALEGDEDIDANLATDSISEAKGAAIAAVGGNLNVDSDDSSDSTEDNSGSLGELIAKVDEQKNRESDTTEINPALIAGAAGAATAAIGAAAISLGDDDNQDEDVSAADSSESDDIVWVEEDRPEIPETKKDPAKKAPPKLEPIVWEVSEEEKNAVSAESEAVEHTSGSDESEEDSGGGLGIAAAAAGVGAVIAGGAALAGDDAEEKSDLKFKFLKFGEDKEDVATEVNESSEESAPVVPPLNIPDTSPVESSDSSEEEIEEQDEAVEEVVSVEAPSGPTVPPLAIPTPNLSSEETEDEPSSAVAPPPIPTPAVPSIDDKVEEVVEQTQEVAEATSDAVGDSIEEAVTSLSDQVSETDDTIAISPALAASAAAIGVGAVAVNLNDSSDAEISKPSLPPIPTPAVTAVEEVTTVSSNIFFDANSAYLKDSELTKVQSIAEAITGGEGRLVKIQGLEDLASSNDFKVLLASRRLLAVKKKLAEKGIAIEKLSINEIQLSEEGRVLEPPSIEISAA